MGMLTGVQTFIPKRLEHFLLKYGEIAKVYVAAFDGDGGMLADFACNNIPVCKHFPSVDTSAII